MIRREKEKFNFNRKAIIATKGDEVKEFESIKEASEFTGYKNSESMRVLIRKRKGIRNGWKFTYK